MTEEKRAERRRKNNYGFHSLKEVSKEDYFKYSFTSLVFIEYDRKVFYSKPDENGFSVGCYYQLEPEETVEEIKKEFWDRKRRAWIKYANDLRKAKQSLKY